MRRFHVLLVAVAASVLVAACAQPAPPAPTAAPAKPAAAPTKAPAPAAAPTKAPAAAPTKAAAPAAPKVSWPEKGKAISIVVAWSAGGAADVGARLIASLMEKDLGTPVQVVNKTGAGGQTGMTEVANSKPDGYTMGVWGLPAHVTIYLDPKRKAVYNRQSLEPVGMQINDSSVIAAQASSPYKTLKDVVDAAKANPGKLSGATSGILSDDHFTGVLFEKEAGIKLKYIHTNGSADALTSILGGHTDISFCNVSQMPEHVKAGKVRVLAITDDEETKYLPGVKTAKAQGYPVVMGAPRGLVAPAGTPKEVLDVLSNSVKKAVQSPEFVSKAEAMSLRVAFMDRAQMAKWWVDYEKQIKGLMDYAGQ